MFVVARCTRRLRREAVLQLADGAGLGRSSSFCWPVARSHTRPLQRCPSAATKDWSLSMRLVVLVDVLADLVDHEEQRLARLTLIEHRLDGLDDLLHRSCRRRAGAGTAVDPAHRLHVPLRVHDVEHVGEVIVGLLVLLGLRPRPPRTFCAVGRTTPLTVALELQLVLGHQVALRAVAEPRLHLPQHGRVDVLVVAGHAPMSKTTAIGLTLASASHASTSSAARGESSRASSASARVRPSGRRTPSRERPRSLAKLDLPEP
jgi:hypothetical protein